MQLPETARAPAAGDAALDVVARLARDDKWQLGGGDGFLFAPPFPVWLDLPGFWDEATAYQYPFGPLFTVTVLDADGRELPLRLTSRRWTPAELTCEYRLPGGLAATEVRTVQPGGIFASEWQIRAPRPTALHFVAWTAQDAASVDLGTVAWTGALTFTREVRDRRDVPMLISAELTALAHLTSWAASLSERTAVQPHWRLAPFVEHWGAAGLACDVRVGGVNARGLLYGAVHLALPATSDAMHATFAMRLAPADASLHVATGPTAARSPARATADAPPDAARSAGTPAGRRATRTPPSTPALAGASRRRWAELFSAVPSFRCSDPYLERYYWYRWYGLWLNAVAGGTGNYQYPTVCEGIDFFHQPISYSAPCHVRELRWAFDHERARGVLRTFFAHQKEDGSLHGRIYVNHFTGTDFYHADWGGAFAALDAVAPDAAFTAEMYFRLSRYAEWLLRTRDAEASGMIDVIDQYETGQEYMSRYQAVDADADRYGWENRIRLKGIDVTVYAYTLLRTLETLAARSAQANEAARWRAHAERVRRAVRDRMWDPDSAMFSDIDPRNGARTRVRAAVCFYPYLTDIAGAEHRPGLERTLLDPRRFWTPFPVPSSAVDDPLFDPSAEWKGKRHLCPWNGRVWPMTNSHLVDALAHQATPGTPRLREACAQLLTRFIRMMFHEGDVDRPNAYEHYNPYTGAPSVYRGIDDYQHSWVNDLIIQYVAGVRPHAHGLVIDPLPLGLDAVELSGVRLRGRRVDVRIDGERVTAIVGGEAHRGAMGAPLELAW